MLCKISWSALFIMPLVSCTMPDGFIEEPTKEIDKNLALSSGKNSLIMDQVLSMFSAPLENLPVIDIGSGEFRKDGRFYLASTDQTYTGQVIEENDEGAVVMTAYFLDGIPNGMMRRYSASGTPVMETLYLNGIISGVKTKWFPDGKIHEEEIWSEGIFKEKKIWDTKGRLVRREFNPVLPI